MKYTKQAMNAFYKVHLVSVVTDFFVKKKKKNSCSS